MLVLMLAIQESLASGANLAPISELLSSHL